MSNYLIRRSLCCITVLIRAEWGTSRGDSVPESSSSIFKFGAYESHPQTRELFKHGSRLKVRPQPLQLLNLLLSRAGDVLTREELRKQLWSSETFVDFEHGLNNSVKELRAILGDSPSNRVTSRRCRSSDTASSLRWKSPNRHLNRFRCESRATLPHPQPSSGPVVPVSGVLDARAGASIAATARRRSWRSWALPGLAAILILLAVGYFQWSRWRTRAQPISGRIMLAVLPFENLTGDPTAGLFQRRLDRGNDRATWAARSRAFGRNRADVVMHYKHGDQPLDQIGRELGVQYVLEGSVRRDSRQGADHSAVNSSERPDAFLAREQYDRELTHLLTLQGEIAQESAERDSAHPGQRSKIAHHPCRR